MNAKESRAKALQARAQIEQAQIEEANRAKPAVRAEIDKQIDQATARGEFEITYEYKYTGGVERPRHIANEIRRDLIAEGFCVAHHEKKRTLEIQWANPIQADAASPDLNVDRLRAALEGVPGDYGVEFAFEDDTLGARTEEAFDLVVDPEHKVVTIRERYSAEHS